MKSDSVMTVVPADHEACPCGNSTAGSKGRVRPVAFGACCGAVLGGAPAANAESLMRSRYTAYVLKQLDYLRSSWHPSTCPADLATDDAVQWLGLKVQWHKPISETEAQVAFLARYKQHGQVCRLQETSRFVKEQGRWLYKDAVS